MKNHKQALDRLRGLQIDCILSRSNLDALRPRFERLANRHENGTAPRAVTAHQLFQTPPELARRLAASLGLASDARVLEPSCGLGRIIDALQPYGPAEVVAVMLRPPVLVSFLDKTGPACDYCKGIF
jgi:hypothetical protein